jgi:hypothetical protein
MYDDPKKLSFHTIGNELLLVTTSLVTKNIFSPIMGQLNFFGHHKLCSQKFSVAKPMTIEKH